MTIPYGEFAFGESSTNSTGPTMFQLRKGYEVDVAVGFVDDQGNPAQIDGAPVWGIADPDVGTIKPASDGMSAVLQGTGDVVGSKTVLTVEADADLGEGIVPVLVSEEVQLISGKASVASIGFGQPRPIAS